MRSPIEINKKKTLLALTVLCTVFLFSSVGYALNFHENHIKNKGYYAKTAGTPVSSNGFACVYCHSDDTVAQFRSLSGDLDVDAAGPGRTIQGTYTEGPPTARCDNVDCHAERTIMADAAVGSLDCKDCHSYNKGTDDLTVVDTDDFIFGESGGTGKMAMVKYIGADSYQTTGHGRQAGAFNSTNPAPGLQVNVTTGFIDSCTTYCHSSAVDHNDPANPFRLTTAAGDTVFTDAGSDLDNTVCLDCHASDGYWAAVGVGGPETPMATKFIGSIAGGDVMKHFGAKHAAATDGGNFCWDCHDPHGDSNDFMIHDGAGVTVASDGDYGVPVTRGAISPLIDVSATGSYVRGDFINDPAIQNGLCQACHTFGGALARFRAGDVANWSTGGGGNNDDLHYAPGLCKTCHPHTPGFEPSGGGGANSDCLDSCHGNVGGGGPTIVTRRNIETDFEQTFQHGYKPSQVGLFDPLDCELCHALGSHAGGTVYLKEWTGAGTWNPILYTPGDLSLMNKVCLSCHTSAATRQPLTNGASAKFPGGAPDMDSRWAAVTTTAPYNKIAPNTGDNTAFPNTVPVLMKSYSPHADGSASGYVNQAKKDMQMDTKMATDHQTAGSPVACFDCHTAHGSTLGSGSGVAAANGNNIVAKNGSIYSRFNKEPVMLRKEDHGNGGNYANEEELCWGCHDKLMDYYGDNDTGGDSPAATDSLEWQGNWSNSIAIYKAGSFESSHFYPSKNGTWSGGSPTGPRNDIYCSSCHNVHGIIQNDTITGTAAELEYFVPILRGPWMTSPYKEDRAPGTVHTTRYTPVEATGTVPRAVSTRIQSNAESGSGYENSANADAYISGSDGYFIDQNTFGVGAYIKDSLPSLDQNMIAGLCLADNTGDYVGGCHVQDPDLDSVSSPDNFAGDGGDAASIFTGHSTFMWDAGNLGTVQYTDIFMGEAGDFYDTDEATILPFGDNKNSYDQPNGGGMQMHDGGSEWNMQWYGAFGDVADTAYGIAAAGNDRTFGTRVNPSDDAASATGRLPTNSGGWPRNFNFTDNWGVDFATQKVLGGTQTGYHQFTCSKCHSPHAGRLPRMMRTNCLDNGSSGINFKESVTDYNEAGPNGAHLYSAEPTNPTGNHSVSSAQVYADIATANGSPRPGPITMNYEAANCHSTAGSTSGGWNRLTPWNEP